jgi:uncharacterized membrane protein HdeD (DUF308 family)
VLKQNKDMLQRVIGIIALVIGVILMVRAHEMGRALGSQVHQWVWGAPTNRATYFQIAGIALAIFGAWQIFWPAKPK